PDARATLGHVRPRLDHCPGVIEKAELVQRTALEVEMYQLDDRHMRIGRPQDQQPRVRANNELIVFPIARIIGEHDPVACPWVAEVLDVYLSDGGPRSDLDQPQYLSAGVRGTHGYDDAGPARADRDYLAKLSERTQTSGTVSDHRIDALGTGNPAVNEQALARPANHAVVGSAVGPSHGSRAWGFSHQDVAGVGRLGPVVLVPARIRDRAVMAVGDGDGAPAKRHIPPGRGIAHEYLRPRQPPRVVGDRATVWLWDGNGGLEALQRRNQRRWGRTRTKRHAGSGSHTGHPTTLRAQAAVSDVNATHLQMPARDDSRCSALDSRCSALSGRSVRRRRGRRPVLHERDEKQSQQCETGNTDDRPARGAHGVSLREQS